MRVELNWNQVNQLLTTAKRFESNLETHSPESAWNLAVKKTFKKSIPLPKDVICVREIGKLQGRVQSIKNEMRSLKSEKVKDPVITVSLGEFNQLVS